MVLSSINWSWLTYYAHVDKGCYYTALVIVIHCEAVVKINTEYNIIRRKFILLIATCKLIQILTNDSTIV